MLNEQYTGFRQIIYSESSNSSLKSYIKKYVQTLRSLETERGSRSLYIKIFLYRIYDVPTDKINFELNVY